jgi:dTDP-4-amino-4,6-dideoxygalactose transaminase
MLTGDSILTARSAYQRHFAGQIGADHAVAFGYARTALWAILSALGLRVGDEVILSPLTCKVVPLTLLALQLKPVYADISADTLNLAAGFVERAMGPRTRAILFQHTYGNAAGIGDLARVAESAGVPVIEDCAQCLPRPGVARFGLAAIFSNNLLKPLPAASGGVAVTNDAPLAKALHAIAAGLPAAGAAAVTRLRIEAWIQRHVLRPELYWLALRCSGRFDPAERPLAAEITAEITRAAHAPGDGQMREGSRWLGHVGDWTAHRLACCEDYLSSLEDCRAVRLPAFDLRQPLYYFPVRSRRKQALLEEARRRRLELIAWPKTTPIYPLRESQLRAYGLDPASCPEAGMVARELIGLPTHTRITARHRREIVHLLRSFDD